MSIFADIKRWFNSMIRSLWGLLKQIFSGTVEIVVAQLMDIAKKTIADLDVETLTNEEKRKEAFKLIAEYAKAHGIIAKDSIINLAIELAVAWLKTQGENRD